MSRINIGEASERGRLRITPIVLCLVAAWLVIQIALPLAALAGPRPGRFGWQMYTTITALPVVAEELRSGQQRPIDVEALLARPRAEADYATALVTRLCSDPEVASVMIDDQRGHRVEPCR